MKKIYLTVFGALAISCSGVKYSNILDGLAKNYTRQGSLNRSDYITFGEIDETVYKKDSVYYIEAQKMFYRSDYKIIDYLFDYKNDTLHYSNWIKTINPLMSRYERGYNNSKSALILIDNYLLNSNHDTIIISSYIDKVKWDFFEKEIKNNNFNKEIKNAYVDYVNSLKSH